MPTGNETRVCQYISDYLSKDDIDSQILEAAPNRGNIVSTLPGLSGNIGLIFMSHTDVVPVEDEDKWSYPPFEIGRASCRERV